jgi:hypothetical protein
MHAEICEIITIFSRYNARVYFILKLADYAFMNMIGSLRYFTLFSSERLK